MTMSRRQALAMLVATAAAWRLPATAQPATAPAAGGLWPSKPVRFVVGAAAGGSASDTVTRYFAERIGERSGQAVVVDNRPGADGNLAAEVVARSAPDAHTFLVTGNNTHAANVHLYKSLSFDPERDFAPVTTYARVPYVLLVNPERVNVRTLKDFIALAKSTPGKFSYASAAVASRVCVEQLKLAAGFDAVNVVYKSGAQAMVDLLGGHVDFYIADAANALQQTKSGRVVALGVTVAQRLPRRAQPAHHRGVGLPGLRLRLLAGRLGQIRLAGRAGARGQPGHQRRVEFAGRPAAPGETGPAGLPGLARVPAGPAAPGNRALGPGHPFGQDPAQLSAHGRPAVV